ncbi:MAG: hypothetical protein WC607_04820 [Candidatus Micrarchaeia archaeon]
MENVLERLKTGWAFAWRIENIKPYLAVYSLFLALLLAGVVFYANDLLAAFAAASAGNAAAFVGVAFVSLGLLFIWLCAFLLSSIYADAAVILHAGESDAHARERYPALFGVMVLVALAQIVLSALLSPLQGEGFGRVLQLLINFGLAGCFILAPYAAVLNRKGSFASISEGAKSFVARPLNILGNLLASVVASLVLAALGFAVFVGLALIALATLDSPLFALFGTLAFVEFVWFASFVQGFQKGYWTKYYLGANKPVRAPKPRAKAKKKK